MLNQKDDHNLFPKNWDSSDFKFFSKSRPEPEWITPEKAEQYLSKNIENNRKISETTVKRYSLDLEQGKWGAASLIQFDENGLLIDGQHRLSAIIKAKKAMPCYVLKNVPNKFVYTIDQHKPRSTADLFNLQSEKTDPNAKLLISTARTLYVTGLGVTKLQFTSSGIPDSLLLDYVKEHELFIRPIVESFALANNALVLSLFVRIFYNFQQGMPMKYKSWEKLKEYLLASAKIISNKGKVTYYDDISPLDELKEIKAYSNHLIEVKESHGVSIKNAAFFGQLQKIFYMVLVPNKNTYLSQIPKPELSRHFFPFPSDKS